MTTRRRFLKPLVFFVAAIGLMFIACAPSPQASPQSDRSTAIRLVSTSSPGANAADAGESTPTPTDIWSVLLQQTPFPYTTPLPKNAPTVLDGLYVKQEPKEGTPVPCRRCPDYLPEGGIWKLLLDKGAFKIFHPGTGWRSLGSFAVTGSQVAIFNDPACFRDVGTYKWQKDGAELSLKVIDDTCHVDRRARSFSNSPWLRCPPPSAGADGGSIPPGCRIEE